MEPSYVAGFFRLVVMLWIALVLLGAGGAVRANPYPPASLHKLYLPVLAEPLPVVPPGFQVTVAVAGLSQPVDVAFLPSGDLLVGEKGQGSTIWGHSAIRLIRDSVLQEAPVVVLSSNVEMDSGILGLTTDPAFATNGYFYVWYAPGNKALGWEGTPILRLSRLTFDPVTGTADPASETILLDRIPWNPFHLGGGLTFDQQGNLYLAIGDLGRGESVQDLGAWHGKVLRIRPEEGGYSIPLDNPFLLAPDARPEIYSLGLRNPFRLAERESDGALFSIDVGEQAWEEVDWLEPAANYGWPEREGHCPRGSFTLPCPPSPPWFTEPVLAYSHQEGISAITALAVYEGQRFPPAYQGKLFFADINSQSLYLADVDVSPPTTQRFATSVGSIVDVEVQKERLYLLDIEWGNLLVIDYPDVEPR